MPETPANLLLGRRMKTAPPEFPGPSVLASANCAAIGEQLELAALVVAVRHGRPVLLAPDGRMLRFYAPCYDVPDELYAPFACFSYPLIRGVGVRLGEHTPRIEVNGAVYRAGALGCPAQCLPSLTEPSFTLFREVHALRRRLGWPERVFVRSPAEPKPIYVDFANPVAVELMVQLAGATTGELVVIEMLPGPDQLWLSDGADQYCCELRTILTVEEVGRS